MIAVMNLAQYILYKCMKDGKPINNIQLQKILYFIQGEHLAQKGVPLFDKDFEAWQYGPVIRSIYSKYCGYGASGIVMIAKPSKELDDEVCKFVNPIVEELREQNAWSLVEKSLTQGGAWEQTFRGGARKYYPIPKDAIKNEFLLLRF